METDNKRTDKTPIDTEPKTSSNSDNNDENVSRRLPQDKDQLTAVILCNNIRQNTDWNGGQHRADDMKVPYLANNI